MNSAFDEQPSLEDPFFGMIADTFDYFLLIAYVLPVYRTVFRIVAEKHTRAKESMRMMGMSDGPYWLSWYTYYTLVNLIITICAGTIIS